VSVSLASLAGTQYTRLVFEAVQLRPERDGLNDSSVDKVSYLPVPNAAMWEAALPSNRRSCWRLDAHWLIYMHADLTEPVRRLIEKPLAPSHTLCN
jgi:hypothetical protein